jgi:hypothetical protein
MDLFFVVFFGKRFFPVFGGEDQVVEDLFVGAHAVVFKKR